MAMRSRRSAAISVRPATGTVPSGRRPYAVTMSITSWSPFVDFAPPMTTSAASPCPRA